MNKVIAVIPARGGSKRIPQKNIKVFEGQPIITRAISLALDCKCFDRVIVSTDSDVIAKTAINAGAEVPFMRPADLADDFTDTVSVIKHTLENLTNDNSQIDLACCLYPTSVFSTKEDVLAGLELISRDLLDYVFSITKFEYPIQRALWLSDDQSIQMYEPEFESTRTQDLIDYYHDAGQFYWGTYRAWTDKRKIFSNKSKPIIIPSSRVQDIDTLEDWSRAELLFKALQLKNENQSNL